MSLWLLFINIPIPQMSKLRSNLAELNEPVSFLVRAPFFPVLFYTVPVTVAESQHPLNVDSPAVWAVQ